MEELLQRAVLVGVNLGNEDDFAYSMEEPDESCRSL